MAGSETRHQPGVDRGRRPDVVVVIERAGLYCAGRVRNEDCLNIFQTWAGRIIIVHAHGVENGRDHLPLNRLSGSQTGQIAHILSAFRHSLSLEVFSLTALSASLDYLDRIWRDLRQLNDG